VDQPAGRYPDLTILEEVGRGGFGRVYRAHHRGLDIPVAVKVLLPSHVDGRAAKLFVREARILARLDHPNLLRVFSYGQGPDGPFIVSEWMDGGELRGPLATPDELRAAGLAAASGLQALHRQQVVHRDVKPANLLRRSDGRIKLGDLGVAMSPDRSCLDEGLTGTIPYLAPEVFDQQRPNYGPPTDLYALGVTLYALWVGKHPFQASGLAGQVLAIGEGTYTPVGEARPGLSPDLEALITELMSRDPEARPTCAEVIHRLMGQPPVDVGAETTLEGPAAPQAAAPSALPRVGPWVLAQVIYESRNWVRHQVHHQATGAPALLARLAETSRLPAELILDSARRVVDWEHPAVVPVLDWGHVHGQAYVVFGGAGQPLDELLRARGPWTEVEALSGCAQVADAVASLHARGLVYQMVEPGSVYASGQAGLTLGWPCFCCPIGTPAASRAWVEAYRCPEAHLESTLQPTADVFGVGCVLCFALTKRHARWLDGVEDRVAALREEAPHVTAPTAELLAALLDPDPAGRPPAAGLSEHMLRTVRRLSL
jgi:serine/threonine protein kinase